MRRGLFGKLAVQNIRNNRSTYIPYMLTCIFCIAMMYMMEFLRDCGQMRSLFGYLARRAFKYEDISHTLDEMNIRVKHEME